MKELSTVEVAARRGVAQVTVSVWCQQGRFPHARQGRTLCGPIWLIPESDLKDFQPPKRGRIPRAQAAIQPTKQRGTIASQTKTTRKLDQGVKRAGDNAMGGKKKGGMR